MEGGAAHGLEQFMCVRGAPNPVYKGGRGEEASIGVTPSGGSPTWTPSPIRAPFLLPKGERGEVREEEKARGGATPTPCPIWFPLGGGRASPLWAGVPPSYGPYGPYLPPGGSGNTPGTPTCTRYILEHFRCPNTIIQYINIYLLTI